MPYSRGSEEYATLHGTISVKINIYHRYLSKSFQSTDQASVLCLGFEVFLNSPKQGIVRI